MTIQSHLRPSVSSLIAHKREMDEFTTVFPDLVRHITEIAKKHNCPEGIDWLEKVLQYNVRHGKKNRGLLAVMTYRSLIREEHLTKNKINLSQYLGWCIELLQTFLIICDDIIDKSTTRRSQLCWYKVKDVGLIAANDGAMIENSMYALLKKYFSHLDCYLDLLDLFHEINFKTICGESLDILTSRKNVIEFTLEDFKAIAANKTSYYTFYLPVASAMLLAGIKDAKVFNQAKSILLEIGELFQIQDDFLDCFGNPELTGKVGTDIQENKCTWLAVICMQRASEEQKAIVAECYGQNDPAKIQKVKDVYNELDLRHVFENHETESYIKIKEQFKQMSQGVPNKILLGYVDAMYQRKS